MESLRATVMAAVQITYNNSSVVEDELISSITTYKAKIISKGNTFLCFRLLGWILLFTLVLEEGLRV